MTGAAVMSEPSRQREAATPWWTARLQLRLAALPTAPRCARGWVRVVLREWQLSHLIDLAELLASELATNAFRASVATGVPEFWLALATDGEHLLISVRDFAPGAPAPRSPGDEDESGRGLQIVSDLSERYGWHPAKDGGPGKVVWVVI